MTVLNENLRVNVPEWNLHSYSHMFGWHLGKVLLHSDKVGMDRRRVLSAKKKHYRKVDRCSLKDTNLYDNVRVGYIVLLNKVLAQSSGSGMTVLNENLRVNVPEWNLHSYSHMFGWHLGKVLLHSDKVGMDRRRVLSAKKKHYRKVDRCSLKDTNLYDNVRVGYINQEAHSIVYQPLASI